MKKVSSFVLFLAMVLILPISAKAESSFKVECDKTTLARGESTNCTYKMITDELAAEPVTSLQATVKTTKDMTIEGFSKGPDWTGTANFPEGSHEGTINLTSVDPSGIVAKEIVIGTITVLLSPDAVECGGVCINVTKYVQGGKEYTGNEVCADFTIDGEPTTTPTPETGAFASYIVLAGGAFLALGTIAIVKRKNKFYHV